MSLKITIWSLSLIFLSYVTLGDLITLAILIGGFFVVLIRHEYFVLNLSRNPDWIRRIYFHQAWYSKWLFDLDPSNIQFLPHQYITQEMSQQIIDRSPQNAKYLPDFNLTSFLMDNPQCFRFYRDRCVSKPDLIKEILKRDIQQFKYLPMRVITHDMVDLAISQDIRLFKHVPQAFVTQDMVDQALKHNILYVKHVPHHFMTQTMADQVMQVNPSYYKYIPQSYRTEQMRERAIQYYRELMLKNINSFCLVRFEFRTEEFLRRFIDSCNIRKVRIGINPHHFSDLGMSGSTFNQLFGACKLSQKGIIYYQNHRVQTLVVPENSIVHIVHWRGYYEIKVNDL